MAHVGGAETLSQSMRVHELLFYARTNDLVKLKKFVQKERINLQSTAACDSDGRSALHVAAAANASAVATWLLEQGCEVNSMDAFLRTPLREASDAGHADMQRKLIAAGGMVHFNDAHLDGGSFCEQSSFHGTGGSGQGLAAAMRIAGASIMSASGHNGPGSSGQHSMPAPPSPMPGAREAAGNSGIAGTAFTVEDWELDPSTLDLSSNMLGSGAFGEVFKATLAPEGPGGEPTPVIVKKVRARVRLCVYAYSLSLCVFTCLRCCSSSCCLGGATWPEAHHFGL